MMAKRCRCHQCRAVDASGNDIVKDLPQRQFFFRITLMAALLEKLVKRNETGAAVE